MRKRVGWSSTVSCCLALVAWALPLPDAQAAFAQDLFLTNANLVDPRAESVERGNLLVLDGRIAGRPDRPPPGFSGRTLDVEGRWILPGLTDLHVHSYGNMAPGPVFDGRGTAVIAKRLLYAGVTAFLDLFGSEMQLFALRAEQRAGRAGGADLFASLSCLTATEGHCTEYGVPTRTMDDPEEAVRQVSELAEREPDVVKIVYAPTGRMPSIDKATLEAAIGGATLNGLKTVIHVRTWEDVRDAVELGATAVTHVPGGEIIPPDLAEMMAERGTYSIPTLAVQTEFQDFVNDPAVLDSPLARALATSQIIEAYRTEEVIDHAREGRPRAEEMTHRVMSSVKRMAESGVTILTGTDAGNWGTIQGYSVHRELIKLVEAGLTPWQALQASTTLAGEFLGRSYGLSDGDEANLVVLSASPIEEIRNTQEIELVIHHGVIVDRDSLIAGN